MYKFIVLKPSITWMLFNTLDFALFLPTVFILYWFVFKSNLKLQNTLIVAASYFFYGWWDWRFLALILFSTIIDFAIGRRLKLEETKVKRKLLLWSSILVNLGFLGFFKYYNFFLENFIEAFSFFGMEVNGRALGIILPVGISFYTFQTMSYTIDVCRNKLEPTDDFISFAAFVSFFPQLVAGPIERASNLLPQFYKKRLFTYTDAVDGLRQILWGLFKKMVIADNCAEYANIIFNGSDTFSAGALVLGAIFFTFQIYGDFSGYSDIAIGTSKLFGFRLKQNFAFPYFSRDVAEFWRRWHISLSTWFRDYLYIPLGGSKGSKWKKIRNVFIIFLVSGFWHGANWTFICWGLMNALFFIPMLLQGSNRKNIDVVDEGRFLPSLRSCFSILSTFLLIMLMWVMFRAESVGQAMNYYQGIFTRAFSPMDFISSIRSVDLAILAVFLLIMLVAEWINRGFEHGLQASKSKYFDWGFYLFLFVSIALFQGKTSDFIYFQF